MLKCFYECLDVSRNATEDEIKRAYRKKALFWHPDKNLHRSEEADRNFKEIIHAYTILKDPHERAWYDGHRDQILRGIDPNKDEKEGGECFWTNLWPYYSTDCFKGFRDDTDDPECFYGVYRDLFYTILEEDLDTGYSDEISKEENKSFYDFGNSTTSYREISSFYQFWRNFVSKHNFLHANQHNLATAENRKIRRLMEKENKKLRTKAKKKRNEQIRHLAEFVYKIDPRILHHRKQQLEQKQNEAKLKEMKKKPVFPENRSQSFDLGQGIEDLNLDDMIFLQEFEDDTSDSNEDQIPLQDMFCFSCNKQFRSMAQLKNHEESKKHKKMTKKLRKEVLLHHERDLSNNNNKKKKNDYNNNNNQEEEEEINVVDEIDIHKTSKKMNNNNNNQEEEEEEINVFDEIDIHNNNNNQEEEEEEINVVDEIDIHKTSKKMKKKMKKMKQQKHHQILLHDDDDDDNHNNNYNNNNNNNNNNEMNIEINESNENSFLSRTELKLLKRKQRKKKKKEQGAASFFCKTCQSHFLSRNSLFKHLKKECKKKS